VPDAPVVLGPNQPPQFYRGGAGIARFRGTPQPSAYAPEDWVGPTTFDGQFQALRGRPPVS
jgi:mannose-6-phosphate isomerase